MDDPQPQARPVLPLEYAPPEAARRLWPDRVLFWSSWVSAVAVGVGALLIPIISVETVLVSGPVVAIFGLLMLLTAVQTQRLMLLIVAIGHVGICGLFVALVNVFHLGPGEAKGPFLVMSLVWGLAALTLTAVGIFQPRRTAFTGPSGS